jgi:anti-sigma factor RsiW
MTKHLTDNQLVEYVYRALTDDQRAEMDRHLVACADCRTWLAEHEGVQRRIHGKIIARRTAATPPSRLTYAAGITRPLTRAWFRLGGDESDACAHCCALALPSC